MTDDDARDKLEALEATVDELGTWECDFVSNLQLRLATGIPLTEAQREKLDEVYARRCERTRR